MILIVDDNPENIFSLRKILELQNLAVDTALSGEEALKKILKNDYSLVILDVQMPGMDGFEVADAISGYSRSKDLPIIFLSAVNTDKQFITKGYASGALDYITKPVDPDILLLKVSTFIRLYEQTRELNEIQSTLRQEIEFRKQAQSELRERVLELRSILESIPQIAFTAKPNGEIEFVNQHWLKYSETEEEFPQTHPEEEPIEKHWKKAIKEHNELEMEVRLLDNQTGEYKCHLLRALPVHEQDKTVKWVGTFTDIEDQKIAQHKKDEFISIASHELKTPLTSIKAYIQLLERSLNGQGSETSANYLQRTGQQLEKLQNLIADLLDISKIESGRVKFNKEPFNLEKVLQNTVEIIHQTNESCTINRNGSADVIVFGDHVRIEQVLINYMTNAIKYSPNCTEIEVNVKVDDDEVQVSVRDFGIGIPKEKQAGIFNKYYRVEDNSNRFQGLGIGLYICAEIIERHKGKFWVNSEPGKGSEFFFTLPLFKS